MVQKKLKKHNLFAINNIQMKKNILLLFGISIGVFMLTSCYHSERDPGYEYAPQMYYPVAYNPDQANPNFKDGKTAQVPVKGSIPVGFEPFGYENTPADYERAGAELKNPIALTPEVLEEGKVLFTNMCSHCHGEEGKADGAVVAAGKFPPPPAYQSEQLKNLSEGKMFFSITYGKNLMGAHASQLSKEERWKIVHYIQKLQKL